MTLESAVSWPCSSASAPYAAGVFLCSFLLNSPHAGPCCIVPMQVAVLPSRKDSRDRGIVLTKMVTFFASKIESKETSFWSLQLSEDPIWNINDLRQSLLRQS